MKRIGPLLTLLFLFPLCGCWDQVLLKDVKIVQGSGIDEAEDGTYELTVALEKSEDQKEIPVLSAKGNTVREAFKHLNRRVSGPVETSNNRLVLVHEAVARKDVFAPLDVIFRDPHNPLTARIAISKETAKQTLTTKVPDEPFIGEHIFKLLLTGEQQAIAPRTTIQMFCSKLFSSTEDAYLPIVSLLPEDKAPIVHGVALFHDTKMTGMLNVKHAKMLSFMNGTTGGRTSLTVEVPEMNKGDRATYVTFNVPNAYPKIKVKSLQPLKFDLNVTLDISLTERSNYEDPIADIRTDMERSLSDYMTKLANETLDQIQQANCDALRLGSKLRAYHHDTWKNLDWSKEYPKVSLQAEVQVRIVGHGVLE